ncbi:cell cycle checkpoint control protein RAD9A isoform X1 [Anguilla rostrata]|uniref:cell cycle checkpoint control protein RAD9A isoform X1 n=1 Tax=Anguilla rostrata TaxID=7938 RepID=UPI0030CBA6B4
MDCMVTGGHVKVLATAIHSLSRIGEDLYLQPQEDELALRTVNSSHSAYACFLFSPPFFQQYSSCKSPTFHCKMAIKCVQAVFRSLSSLEKMVERCRIQLNSEKSRLTFTLHCKHGLLKTHNLSIQDCESLQAVFNKESCANVLRAQPRLLVETVLHFPTSVEEVSVSVSSERVCFRNHVEEEAEQSKAVLTELSLSAKEFEQFTVGCPGRVTFCLKEMRGLLMFAESSGLPVSLHFDEPGRPVILSLTESVLEVNFVLATLSEDSHLCNHFNNSTECHQNPALLPDDFMNDDIDSYLIAMETSELASGGSGCPPTLPRKASMGQLRARASSEGEEEEEEEEEMGRPPNEKFHSLFFGSMLPTSSQTLRTQEVLASDSENEEEDSSF